MKGEPALGTTIAWRGADVLSRLHDNMHTTAIDGARWPFRVNVAIGVEQRSRPSASWHFLLAPCRRPGHDVRVTTWTPGVSDADVAPVDWTRLPGRLLFQRALNVLAVRLFGSFDMTPRIVGAPMWSELIVEISPPEAAGATLRYEVLVDAGNGATLRFRRHAQAPVSSRSMMLQAADADPLRAAIRIGRESVYCAEGARRLPPPPAWRREPAAATHSLQS